MSSKEMIALEKNTQAVYERNGPRFDRERPKTLYEKDWLERFLELLPSGAKVLDAGCGAGEPIARYFIERGIDLTGIDFSTTMLDIAHSRFPDHQWHLMDMRHLNLPDKFDGIVAWHSFFHLAPDDQRITLRNFAEHLVPGGAVMLTIGCEETEVIGNVGDDKVYHAGLTYETYESLLRDLGMVVAKFTRDDPECDGASILLARKN